MDGCMCSLCKAWIFGRLNLKIIGSRVFCLLYNQANLDGVDCWMKRNKKKWVEG